MNLYHEVLIYPLRTRHIVKGWKITKIDLEKAYDRFKWIFIEDIGLKMVTSF